MEKIQIKVGRKIFVYHLSDTYKNHLKKALTIANPMWIKLSQMAKRDPNKRRALYGCKQEFKYYEEEGDVLIVPRGMIDRLLVFFDIVNVKYDVAYNYVYKQTKKLDRKGAVLRDYQEPIVKEVVKSQQGIIVMGTGSGKSIVGAEIIKRLGLTATVLVPNNTLLSQWVEEFKKHYGYDVGIIGDGKKEIKDITVSTFQSLYKNGPLRNAVSEHSSIIMVDECQNSITTENKKVLESMRPTHFYGLTATPYRSAEDGQTDAIGFYFGGKLCDYATTQAVPTIIKTNTNVDVPMSSEYHEMIHDMVENEERNNLINFTAYGEAISGRKILVLTKRVAHAETLYEYFKDWDDAYLINSKNKERNVLLSEFKSGKRDFKIIFGTTALLAVGVDVPMLDTLIMACDMKSEVLTVQSSGRVLRLFEGKADPRIYDLVDNRNPILNKQWFSRKRMYDMKGWKIV